MRSHKPTAQSQIDDGPVYTASPNPSLASFTREKSSSPLPVAEQPSIYLPGVVRGFKTSHIYNAHTYHTKVPPEVIEQFVLQFTKPGDLVLDPFAGSGMTGVAALKHGRRVVLIDLSPFATFLCYNHCTPLNVLSFRQAVDEVYARVSADMAWLYETPCRRCGQKAVIKKMIWSEAVECPGCLARINVWDVALDETRRIRKTFLCTGCGKRLQRGMGRRLDWSAVQLDVQCSRCGRETTQPLPFDLDKIAEIERAKIPQTLWYPRYKMPRGDMWRRGYHEGIETVADFYTKRNLWALARLREEIAKFRDVRLRNKLLFVFTNVVWHGCRMRRFNPRGGARPMNAALYIPALMEEANVLSVFMHKADMVSRMLWETRDLDPHLLRVSTQSATDLSSIPDGSVDYIFTDPPYGGNILYSEVNFLWEAWLGQFTDATAEIVISRSQKKTVGQYRDMLGQALAECFRVLKRGGHMTLTFNTSKREVWNALQDALWRSGFRVQFVQILDKGHPSFKQLTSELIPGYDVVITCAKAWRPTHRSNVREVDSEEIEDLVRNWLTVTDGHFDPQQVYANLIADLLSHGRLVSLSYKDFLRLVRHLTQEIKIAKKPRSGGGRAGDQLTLPLGGETA